MHHIADHRLASHEFLAWQCQERRCREAAYCGNRASETSGRADRSLTASHRTGGASRCRSRQPVAAQCWSRLWTLKSGPVCRRSHAVGRITGCEPVLFELLLGGLGEVNLLEGRQRTLRAQPGCFPTASSVCCFDTRPNFPSRWAASPHCRAWARRQAASAWRIETRA